MDLTRKALDTNFIEIKRLIAKQDQLARKLKRQYRYMKWQNRKAKVKKVLRKVYLYFRYPLLHKYRYITFDLAIVKVKRCLKTIINNTEV